MSVEIHSNASIDSIAADAPLNKRVSSPTGSAISDAPRVSLNGSMKGSSADHLGSNPRDSELRHSPQLSNQSGTPVIRDVYSDLLVRKSFASVSSANLQGSQADGNRGQSVETKIVSKTKLKKAERDINSIVSKATSTRASHKSTRSKKGKGGKYKDKRAAIGSVNRISRTSSDYTPSPSTPTMSMSNVRSSRSSIGSRLSRTLNMHQTSDPTILRAKKQTRQNKPILKSDSNITKDILHSGQQSMSVTPGLSDTDIVNNEEMLQKRLFLMAELRKMPDIDDLSESSWVPYEDLSQSAIVQAHVEYKPHIPTPTYERSQSLAISNVTADNFKVKSDTSFESVTTLSSISSMDSFDDSEMQLLPVKYEKQNFEETADVAKKLTVIQIRCSTADIFEYDRNAIIDRQVANEACQHLLDGLIRRAVSYCEQRDVHLARLLDKEKLLRELIPLIQQLEDERLIKNKLEQYITDHFVRKKLLIFVKNSKHFDALNHQRYHESLQDLDRQLEIQTKTSEKAQSQVNQLREELTNSIASSDQKILDFEQVVRQTILTNDSFTHLAGTVDSVLTSMRRLRRELSELRLDLFNTQHRFADMQLKSEQLEDLGGGLNIQDYLSSQTDAVTLRQKISERDGELNRLHMKIRYEVQALAHLKCKEQMYRQTYMGMLARLKECEESRNRYRALIYQGKLIHNKLFREIDKIRNCGSLMFYPSLMKDYDDNEAVLMEKRHSVKKLRFEYNRLISRIAHAEALAKRRKSNALFKMSKLNLTAELLV